MDLSELNRPNWIEVDQNRLIRPKWTKLDQNGQNGLDGPKLTEMLR